MTLLELLFGKTIRSNTCLVQRYMGAQYYSVHQRLSLLSISARLQRNYKPYD